MSRYAAAFFLVACPWSTISLAVSEVPLTANNALISRLSRLIFIFGAWAGASSEGGRNAAHLHHTCFGCV